MQLTVFVAWFLASVAGMIRTETIGHVTRDYFGDIFTLGDCEPGSCDRGGRRAAQIPGERCRCQCAPSHYTFREDMRQCIKDVGECPVAMFVRPFAVERIPLVFLPMTGQLVYPGAHLTVSGIARLAPSKHLSCNVKSSLLMTSHGWQPIRTPSHIFGVYYDGNKTFLQWLGDDEERRRLQHHLVLIRLTCEGETSNGTFEPCAALRIGWAPGLDVEATTEPVISKNNYLVIGLCVGILGLVYVGAVLVFMKVRKRRRSMSREGFAPSHTTIESNEEEEGNNAQLRSAYINNLVQEAELTSQKSTGKDFKERDMDVTTGERKSLNGKLGRGSKMESIHGRNLGAAMLESKLAPPEPPPRSLKSKNKKRAPSPPGRQNSYSTTVLAKVHNSEDCSIPSLSNAEKISKFDLFRLDLYDKINRIRDGHRDPHNEEEDIAVLDILEEKSPPDLVTNSASREETKLTTNESISQQSNKISRKQMLYKLQAEELSNKKSAPREVAQEENPSVISEDSDLEIEDEQQDDDDWASSHAGSVVEETLEMATTPVPTSRPLTASSSRSLPVSVSGQDTAHSQKGSCGSTLKRNGGRRRKSEEESMRREQPDEDLRSEVASLSGDSLNSSFRRPMKSPSSMKSKKSGRSFGNDDEEDMSVLSSSTMVTSSTAIKELEGGYDDDDDYDETMDEEDSQFSTDIDPDMDPADFSLDESEHPSLEEYLQLSTQVAKKLSERTVPVFTGSSQREKNVISQFMKEFKTTIGRLRSADEGKPKLARTPSPGTDNWTLKKEEKSKSAKVTRKVSIFKRNPLKSRKHVNNEYLVHEGDSHRNANGYYVNPVASETEDTASCISERSSLSGGRGKNRYKTPEIIPAGKMLGGSEKTVIAITNEEIRPIKGDNRGSPIIKTASVNGSSVSKLAKAVTPPLPPPKPSMEQLKSKAAVLRKGESSLRQNQHLPITNSSPTINGVIKHKKSDQPNRRATKSPARHMRAPSIDSDSISVANSDMTEDSLNTSTNIEIGNEDDVEDDLEEDGPIDRCLAQLADSVIQSPDDCSLNRYLSQLGTVLAAREDSALDQCLNKLASNMNESRATKGFNLSQHLPLGTWEHVCIDRGSSERSTPTSDRSTASRGSSRGSQEHLRKKSKHHHHRQHGNGHAIHIPEHLPEVLHTNHSGGLVDNRLLSPSSGDNSYTTCIHVERSGSKQSNNSGCSRITSISEDEESSRASSLGSTRELRTPVSETTSDPSSLDLERPRKRRPVGKRPKKVLNGTCRQHIQNSKHGKESGKKAGYKQQQQQQRSSDVTVIQLEGEPGDHVTKVESSNTFVTLINVDSSDCSNSAEEK